MELWKRYKPDETMYDGHRKVIRKHFENSAGRTFDFETFEKQGSESVVVLALDKDNAVLVAEQFRVGPERVMQDCPGGGVGRDQTPAMAAQVELLQETGYESDEWAYLGATHEHPYSNRNRHYFLARNVRQVAEPTPDDLEDITLKKISINQLIENATSGRMTDALIVLYAWEALKNIQERL